MTNMLPRLLTPEEVSELQKHLETAKLGPMVVLPAGETSFDYDTTVKAIIAERDSLRAEVERLKTALSDFIKAEKGCGGPIPITETVQSKVIQCGGKFGICPACHKLVADKRAALAALEKS